MSNVDEGVFRDFDHARVRVHLNLGNMTAIREGGGRAVDDLRDVEALRQFRRQGEARMKPLGQFRDADRAVGAGDHEAAGAELDVGRRRLKHMRGDLAAGFDHLIAGMDDRVAANDHRFGAAGAAAGDQLVAVAL